MMNEGNLFSRVFAKKATEIPHLAVRSNAAHSSFLIKK